jgi:primary-amine oxidase
VESNVRLGPNVHGNGDYEELFLVEKNALEDEGVRAEIAKLKLPEGAVVCADPWIYGQLSSPLPIFLSLTLIGSDGVDDDRRMYQVFLYMRDPANAAELDSNHYAFPLAISPVLDTEDYKVIRIDQLPTGADATVKPTQPWVPHTANEYISEHQTLRTDLKPLQVVQPEGASFTVTAAGETGEVVSWQKWTFRVGFNQREGMILYDVRYDGRSLFYRVSLSDMNIPYGDPRHPFHKKSAFDLGDAGAGAMANNLKLGCDCLGNIHYLSGVIGDDKGAAVPIENCICIHEQDNGIGWKHTNYRTGRAVLVRNRELVVQSIITVSNYEYIMAFMFNQAGEVSYEVRATGILSTQPIDEGVSVPWGTVVHPGVLATYHQHIFSLRVDPALDGHANRLVYQEAYPMPPSDLNPHLTGYTTSETVITHSSGLDLSPSTNRVFKIQNASHLNPINSLPVAYKIHVPPFQPLLAHPSTFNHKRAEFGDHAIYVTSHRDEELYSGGWYTNQSRGGTGVRSWAARNDNVKDTDMVVWVQFGINHVPRIEDFPVMPCETIKVSFKPVNFFDKNPSLDVPPSEQVFNKSTLEAERHAQGSVEREVGKQGEVCHSSKL